MGQGRIPNIDDGCLLIVVQGMCRGGWAGAVTHNLSKAEGQSAKVNQKPGRRVFWKTRPHRVFLRDQEDETGSLSVALTGMKLHRPGWS